MRILINILPTWLFVALSCIQLNAQQGGNLVIVGGALDSNNEIVYETFINLAGDKKEAVISVIPAASGSPSSSSESFRNNLIRYGVHPGNIHIIPVALFDCPSTPDIDESTWKDGAEDPQVAELLGSSTGIWFTGGDQSRIIATFVRNDGTQTPALQAIMLAWLNGAVIGGTSAGAAIMSEIMITGGVSMASLKHGITDKYIQKEQQDNGPLTLGKGLGFFKYGIIDQHFDKKNRLGRLVVATMHNKETFPFGFGIDENTALVYYSKTGLIEVAGEGGVTIVDVRKAKMSKMKGKYKSYTNIDISYIEQGDAYTHSVEQFEIHPDKKPTTGNEYYSIPTSVQSGIFSSYSSTYRELISYHLIDNRSNDKVISYCYDDDPVALKVVFSKKENSRGYWTNNLTGRDNYSFLHIGMDVIPVRVRIKNMK